MADPVVTVIAPDGTPGTLPASQAPALVDAGGRVLGKKEAATVTKRAALEDQFESSTLGEVEGTVAPIVAGAARGLSLGGSDLAMSKLGGDKVRKRLLDYQEYAPVASAGGEIGGIAIGAMLGDEAGLGALPNAVSRMGARTGAAVAEGLGGGALARGAGVLARGGAEGAAFGVGGKISEAALHDSPLTGEALIGGAGEGALGGLVVSGLLHGAGAGLGAAKRGLFRPSASAIDSLAAREFGEAAPGVGKAIASDIAADAKAVTPSLSSEHAGPYRTSGAADRVGETYLDATTSGAKREELGEIWRNRAVAFNDGAERIEGHSRDLQKAITRQQEAAKITDMATFGDSKVNHMDKLVDRARFNEQSDSVMQWMFKANEEIQLLAQDTAVTKLGPAARKEFESQMQRMASAMETGDSLKLFKAADDAKRFVGRQAQFGHGARGLTESAKSFDALYQGEGGLMRVLEDPSWGKAASAQRAVNAATTESIGLGKKFGSSFVEEYGSTAGRPDYRANSEKVSAFLGRLTKAANEGDSQAVRDMVASRRKFLDATASNYDHGPQAVKAIAAERQSLDAMETTFNTATKETTLINQVKRLQSEEQAQRLGGFLGLAMDTASKPVSTLQRLAQIEQHTQSILDKISGGTKKLVNAEVPSTAERAAGATSGKGFFSALLEGASGKAATVGTGAVVVGRREYERNARAVASLQGNTALLSSRVGAALGSVSSDAPKATAAATSVAMTGLQFLASKMPPSRSDAYSLQPQFQQSSRASDSEISRQMRYQEALDHPTMVLAAARNGTLSRDHVEAVKAVYPKLYQHMQEQVMREIVTSTSELPYGRRIQLGILLDIPTDRTLAPDFQQALQATYSSAEQAGEESPSPQLARPLAIASGPMTSLQAAMSEGLEK